MLRQVGLEPEVANTRAYADYILAWGLARLADYTSADELRRQAASALPADDPVHAILRDAFEFRIKQVRDGKPPRGPLPDSISRQIDSLERGRYAIDKLRERLRILEPASRVSAYDIEIRRGSERRSATPAQVAFALPAGRFRDEIGRLLSIEMGRRGRPHLSELTEVALNRVFEVSDANAEQVLAALPAALDAARQNPRLLASLLERGFAAAAVWDRGDMAHDLAVRFLHFADGRTGWDLAEGVIGPALRCFRRLGLKTDANMVLHVVAARMLQGQPIGRLRASRPGDWPTVLRILLQVAAGWYFAGNDDDAYAVLNKAQKDLFAPETTTAARTKLALAYVATLAQAPTGVTLGRLEEIFQTLKGIKAEGTTNEYYSLQPLILIESAVRAVVSDEFAVGLQVRAWLDADELAVRRRIRDELKEALKGQDFN